MNKKSVAGKASADKLVKNIHRRAWQIRLAKASINHIGPWRSFQPLERETLSHRG